jgi:hypothetical protein
MLRGQTAEYLAHVGLDFFGEVRPAGREAKRISCRAHKSARSLPGVPANAMLLQRQFAPHVCIQPDKKQERGEGLAQPIARATYAMLRTFGFDATVR